MDGNNRVFNFAKEVTYIEHQEVTVEAGGVFNNGPHKLEDEEEEPTPQVAQTMPDAKFGFIIYSHHSPKEIDARMECLRLKCQRSNSRALMRLLNDLDKDGYIDISDVSAAELYTELKRVFGLPGIKQKTFAEAYRLIG